MSEKPDPKKLLDQLVNTQDLTPEKVREIVDAAVPVPPPTPKVNVDRSSLDVETALKYLELNRR